MNEILNKLIMYHQIHKMFRDSWSKSRISEFLGINWRTVSKYLDMSEEEFLAYIEAQSNRQKLLAPYEGFVKIKLEQYPDTKAAQIIGGLPVSKNIGTTLDIACGPFVFEDDGSFDIELYSI